MADNAQAKQGKEDPRIEELVELGRQARSWLPGNAFARYGALKQQLVAEGVTLPPAGELARRISLTPKDAERERKLVERLGDERLARLVMIGRQARRMGSESAAADAYDVLRRELLDAGVKLPANLVQLLLDD